MRKPPHALILAAAVCAAAPAAASAQAPPDPCTRSSEFVSITVSAAGQGVSYSYRRRGNGPVRVELFRQSVGGKIVGERRVAVLSGSESLGPLRDGYYMLRFTARAADGSLDQRRVPLRRLRGRFRVVPDYDHRDPCALIQAAKTIRPVFGGKLRNEALNLSFRLAEDANVSIEVRRAGRVVRRMSARRWLGGRTHRVRLPFRTRIGRHTVRIRAATGDKLQTVTLTVTRL